MTTYTIRINDRIVTTVEGTEIAYACYKSACEIADMTGEVASLVCDETGETVAYSDDFDDYDRDYEPDVDETGFDPYEGCYTWDC